MNWIWDSSEKLSQLASVATALIAVLGLAGVWFQLRTTRHAAAETAATNLYVSLLTHALNYPQFVAPNESLIDTHSETFDGSGEEFRRYEVFVELMLTTFDELLRLYPQDTSNRNYMLHWMGEHYKYLDSP
jgi:hypothetical protein